MKLRHCVNGVALVVSLVAASARARADVTDDCIGANEKAISLRKAGRLVDARAETAKCAIEACGDEIQRVCSQRADEINASLPSILFEVTDENGVDVTSAKVTIDGRPADKATTSAVPLDPGEHKFVIEVGGRTPIERTILLREGDRQRRERVALARVDAPSAPPPDAQPVLRTDEPSSGSTQRIIGLSIGGVGVVGLVLGTVFAFSAKGSWDDAQTKCPKEVGCGPGSAAYADKDSAQSAATLSTVSFIGGAVLVAGGVALFFTAPKSSASGTTASPPLRLVPTGSVHAAGVSFGGSF